LEAILLFLFGLFVFAALGHGIWVFFAWLFRLLSGETSNDPRFSQSATIPNRRAAGDPCPVCAIPLTAARACHACGWPEVTQSKLRRRDVALASLRRSAKRFFGMGWLDQESYDVLEQTFEARAHAVQHAPPVPVAESAAVGESAASASVVSSASAEEGVPATVAPVAAPPEPPPLDFAGIVTPPPPPVTTTVTQSPDVPTRVAAYMAARRQDEAEQKSADREEVVAAPASRAVERPRVVAPPREPAKPFSRIFASFLEEKNIRWGELIGGLLILCSSIALVLSFWQQIAERPLLKFGLFNGVTAALFGIGLYVHRRWRLPTTTHGVLLIAMLLVPLNFLAIAAFTLNSPPTDALTLGGEFASLALFAWLTYRAAQVVVPPAAVATAAAMIGCAAWQLVVRRFAGPDMNAAMLWLLGSVPVAAFIVPTGMQLRRIRKLDTCGEPEANLLFQVVGTTLFAAVLPLGVLLAKAESFTLSLARLAPLVSIMAGPLVAVGLLLWRRLTQPELLKERIAGTAVAVFGVGVIVAAAGASWPVPAGMLPVAVIDAVLLTWIALRSGVSAVHLPAALCATLAYLVGLQLVRGELAWNGADVRAAVEVLFCGAIGLALVVPTLLLPALVALRRFAPWSKAPLVGEARQAAFWYVVAAGLCGAASVGLLAYFSWDEAGDPWGVRYVFALYGAGALAAAGAVGRREFAYAGSILLGVAMLQAQRYFAPQLPPLADTWTALFLAHAGLMLGVAWCAEWIGRGRVQIGSWKRSLVEPLVMSATATSLWAVPALVLEKLHNVPREAAAAWSALAAIWSVLFWRMPTRGWFAMLQTAALAAVGTLVHHGVTQQTWYAEALDYPALLDPRAVQTFALAAAGYCAAWLALRLYLRRRAATNVRAEVIRSEWTIDRVVKQLVVAAALGLSLYAVLPGAWQELSFRTFTPPEPRVVRAVAQFQIANIPHVPARAVGGWLLLVAAAGLTTAGLWERFRTYRLVTLVLLGAAASPLVAARYDDDTAAATALLWTAAAALVALSVPLWLRAPLVKAADRAGWPGWQTRPARLSRWLFGVAVGASLLPAVGTMVDLGLRAVARYHAAPRDWLLQRQLPIAAELDEALVGALFVALGGFIVASILYGLGRKFAGREGSSWTSLGAIVVGLLGCAPTVVVAIYSYAVALKAFPILGPDPNSALGQTSLATRYALPLLATAAALVGHAVSFRSPRLAFASGLVLNLAATAGFILALVPGGLKFDPTLWLHLGQLNAAVSALYAVAWSGLLIARRRPAAIAPATPEESVVAPLPPVSSWLTSQTALAAAWASAGIVGSLLPLMGQQGLPDSVANLPAWLSLACVTAAVFAYYRASERSITVGAWTCVALAASALAGLYTARFDVHNVVPCLTLAGLWLLVGYGTFAAGLIAERWNRLRFGPPASVARWATFVALLTLWVSQNKWLSLSSAGWHRPTIWDDIGLMGAAPLLAPLLAGLAAWRGSRGRLYMASACLCWGTAAFWLDADTGRLFFPGYRDDQLGWALLVAWALPVPLWCLVEVGRIMPLRPSHGWFGGPRWLWLPPLHRLAALSSLLIVGGSVVAGLSEPGPSEEPAALMTAVVASMLVAVVACLWDARSRGAVLSLYIAGLVAVGAALDQFDISQTMRIWLGMVFTASYALGVSYLWSRRAGLQQLCAALRMPPRYDDELAGQAWLVPATYVLAVGVLVPAVWAATTLETFALRVAAAHAVVASAVSLGMLARGERRSPLQRQALLLGAAAAVLAVWAGLQPGASGELLNRAVAAAAAGAGVVALYGLGFTKILKKENQWTAAALDVVPWLCGLTGATLVFVLSVETYEYFALGQVLIGRTALATVIVALAALVFAALVAALVPGRDPLRLSERGRTAYVYAAEVLLALMFLHIRITLPELFTGYFSRYWPVIVMALAFAGVALSEWFRRRNQAILSEPLERTGALLPLLPVFGYWAGNPEVHYSLVLVAVGGLYAALAVLRKSFGFGILATLAANGGLWYFLDHQDGLGLLEHPQLWLIPPALCVLVAAHLNRRQMTAEQSTAVRYGAASVVYAASTADIFLNGVAEAPYLPLVLAAFSIAGMLAGIALRIRAFLYLGLTFLMLALATIIWHAGYNLDRTWIFYVTGIVSGVLIIALFAVFEKKREEVLRVVETLKNWD
jgi:hypothetical protein